MAHDAVTHAPLRTTRTVAAAALTTLVASLAIAVPAVAGGPTTRYVDDDDPGCGPDPYATVQAAVDASDDGDTILVCPGVYPGQVLIDDVSDLTVRGVDPWTAKLVAAPDHPDDENLITVSGVSGTRLQWLRIVAPAGDGSSCNHVQALIVVAFAPDTTIRANQLRVMAPTPSGVPVATPTA